MRATRPPRTPNAERCQHCGVGLRHELLIFRAHLIDTDWTLCPACVPPLLARFAQSHARAEEILDEIWNVPSREPGSW